MPNQVECARLLCVQLHQDSPHVARDTRHGGWRNGSAVGSSGPGCGVGSQRAEGGKSGIKSRVVDTPIKFRTLLAASVAVALGAALIPRYLGPDVSLMLLWNLALGIMWCALVVATIFWHRWRGLWLLVCAPLLVYWPVAFWLMDRACAQNINACL